MNKGGPSDPSGPTGPVGQVGSVGKFGGLSRVDDHLCSKCQRPLIERPEYPFPVLLQSLFAASFVGFLVFFDKVRAHAMIVWIWCAVQVVLGLALTRARIRARRKIWQCVYGCIPGNSPLR